MDPRYAREYRALYEKHWWWRAREKVILAELKRRQPPAGWRAILDVGCGDGLLFEKLQSLGHVEGVEMDPTGMSPDSAWSDRIHVAPFDESFRPGKKYSLVLMLDVLEHFADPISALARALELLEPQGTLVVSVPAFPILWTSHDEINHHYIRFTRSSLANVARKAHGRIVYSHYFFRWAFPVKLLVRLKEALLPAPAAPPRSPAGWLNGLLYRLSTAEETLLGRLPIPFGSSLLAVARKNE